MQNAESDTEVLGIEQVMAMLRVSRSGLYVLVRDRRVPGGAKIGRKRLWLRSDILAFLERKGGKA